MRQRIVLLVLILGVGIAIGIVGPRIPSAQQAEIKRTELLRTELPGLEGKEAVVFMAEIPPGVMTGKHRHPGNELIYVLQGSYVLEIDGKGAIPLKGRGC